MTNVKELVVDYCGNHSNCMIMNVPNKCQKIPMGKPSSVAYIGIGTYKDGIKNICYLKLCDTAGKKYIVEDVVGNRYTYGRENIIAYISLPSKKPDNEKEHTVMVHKKMMDDSFDLKCYYCNGVGKEHLLYHKDGKRYCTAVCGNLCMSIFERESKELYCIECTGGTSLFKQRWLGFQNDDDRVVRFRYCHGSAECMDNLTCKFQKVTGSELMHRCENVTCSKAGTKQELKQCGDCRAVYYCSRECQVQDWKVHKLVCKSLNC